jgi:hypothetical protein
MAANTLENWANFFITSAEVSATLAGLVIVAVSVNIQFILQHAHLPPRASATVAVLMLIVASGLAALVPQAHKAFATEVVLFTLVIWAILLPCARTIVVEHLKAGRPVVELLVGLSGGCVSGLVFLIGGVLLWFDHADGLYWIAGGIVSGLLFAVLNAWVFLIEVLR